MTKTVLLASLSGAVALASTAWADTGAGSAQAGAEAHHGHRDGLIGQALALDTLTPAQRTAIEALAQTRRTTNAPVRAAEAQVLTTLARQVEAGALDRQALAPSVQAKENAEVSARAGERDLTQKLHDVLNPAQRGQVVDALEAHGRPGGPHSGGRPLAEFGRHLGLSPQQTEQIATNLRAERQAEGHGDGHRAGADGGPHGDRMAWLESFRGDTFVPPSANTSSAAPALAIDHRDGRFEDVLQAALPVLTADQRTELASHLRRRAAQAQAQQS